MPRSVTSRKAMTAVQFAASRVITRSIGPIRWQRVHLCVAFISLSYYQCTSVHGGVA